MAKSAGLGRLGYIPFSAFCIRPRSIELISSWKAVKFGGIRDTWRVIKKEALEPDGWVWVLVSPPLPSITTLGKLQGLSSRIYTMRTVIISTWGQFHWQSTSAIAYGLCLKGPQAWGLVLYNCHLESLNNSNIFNYSVKSYRAMDHEWGRLGSLAHTQFCLLLPLPVLNLLLPSSWCP